MAMNKAEKAELEQARSLYADALALKATPKVYPDLAPPAFGQGLTVGFHPNMYNKTAYSACSSSRSHSIHRTDHAGQQGSMSLYSRESDALRAVRNMLEEVYAKNLREVDQSIQEALLREQVL